MIASFLDISLDKLHKNIEVHLVDVPASEFIRTISEASKFLLPVPNDAADDFDYIIIDTHYHFDTTGWSVNHQCHQRRLRRLCMYGLVTLNTIMYCNSREVS